MKRVVYSPKVQAFVKTDSGIYDLSSYLVRGSVQRKLDQVSTASLEFRNPDRIFTEGDQGAVIHPMDPIIIFMTRIEDRPVQVFTGYVDSSPYKTLKPGVVALTASCTLKRLLYTYYDPGLDYFHKFLHMRGWITTPGLGISSGSSPNDNNDGDRPNQGDSIKKAGGELNDSSFGQLLYDTLRYVGNWPDDTIWIENLPEGIVDLVESIFYQIENASTEQRKALRKVLKQILEHNEISAGGVGGGGGVGITTGGASSNYMGDINHKFTRLPSGSVTGPTLPRAVVQKLGEAAGRYMGYSTPGVTMERIIDGESGRRPGTFLDEGNGVMGWGLWAHTSPYFDHWAEVIGGYEEFLNPVKSGLIMVVSYWMVMNGQATWEGMWHGGAPGWNTNVHYTGDYDIRDSLGGKTFEEAADSIGGQSIRRAFHSYIGR